LLNELIADHRQEILARTQAKLALRYDRRPSGRDQDHGAELFLEQMTALIRHHSTGSRETDTNTRPHGGELLRRGYSVSRVVHGYGDVCQVISDLAQESGTALSAGALLTFQCCLDEAIAGAITEYERQREAISRRGAEPIERLAEELRDSLSTALLGFATLQRGVLRLDSNTGALLNRSLMRLVELTDRSLSEVRLAGDTLHLQRLSVADLVQEVAIAAGVYAANRGVSFSAPRFETRLEVEGDRHLLIAAIQNIVQNALKFTPVGGRVSLTVRDAATQIMIDVADECGGLDEGDLPELLNAFARHGVDHAGLGPGLWISRTSITKMGGTLSARNVAGRGCVFSIALPKLRPAVATLAGAAAGSTRAE